MPFVICTRQPWHSAGTPIEAQYFVIEFDGPWASTDIIVSEIVVEDDGGTPIVWAPGPADAYDEVRDALLTGYPYYWNGADSWARDRLVDGNTSTSSAYASLIDYSTTAGTVSRLIIDLGSVQSVSAIKIYSGQSTANGDHKAKTADIYAVGGDPRTYVMFGSRPHSTWLKLGTLTWEATGTLLQTLEIEYDGSPFDWGWEHSDLAYFLMSDLNDPSEQQLYASDVGSTHGVEALFSKRDIGETNGQWYATTSTNYATIDLGSAQTVSSYAIQNGSDALDHHSPTSWTLQYSDDNVNWTTADTVTSSVVTTPPRAWRGRRSITPVAARYWKLDITATASTGTCVGKFRLFKHHERGAVVTGMTSNTAPSPQVASASSTYSTNYPYKAFSQVNAADTDAWASSAAPSVGAPQYLQIDMGAAYLVRSYSIANKATTDYGLRCPRQWTLQSSNDGSSWAVRDTRTFVGEGTAAEVKDFDVAEPASARYWRLSITDMFPPAAGGSSRVYVGEFQLYRTVSALDEPREFDSSRKGGTALVSGSLLTTSNSGYGGAACLPAVPVGKRAAIGLVRTGGSTDSFVFSLSGASQSDWWNWGIGSLADPGAYMRHYGETYVVAGYTGMEWVYTRGAAQFASDFKNFEQCTFLIDRTGSTHYVEFWSRDCMRARLEWPETSIMEDVIICATDASSSNVINEKRVAPIAWPFSRVSAPSLLTSFVTFNGWVENVSTGYLSGYSGFGDGRLAYTYSVSNSTYMELDVTSGDLLISGDFELTWYGYRVFVNSVVGGDSAYMGLRSMASGLYCGFRAYVSGSTFYNTFQAHDGTVAVATGPSAAYSYKAFGIKRTGTLVEYKYSTSTSFVDVATLSWTDNAGANLIDADDLRFEIRQPGRTWYDPSYPVRFGATPGGGFSADDGLYGMYLDGTVVEL